jgi:predicted nuclease of restriction endonuclease-like (RecB) superfamily
MKKTEIHEFGNDLSKFDYKQLVSQISSVFILGQQKAVSAINTHLVETYWRIGQYIVEYEQNGSEKAEYGKKLLENLSKDLSLLHGKGFSRSNIQRMRQFYITYPICAKPSHKLSWSVPELQRQKKTSLFLRLASSTDKKGILELAQKGQVINNPIDIIREPYILDFLQIPEAHGYSETELEESIISRLQQFLLELGKGFL